MRQGERRRHGRRGAGADAAGGNGKARGGVEPQGRPRGLRMSECWRKTRPGRGDLSRRAAPGAAIVGWGRARPRDTRRRSRPRPVGRAAVRRARPGRPRQAGGALRARPLRPGRDRLPRGRSRGRLLRRAPRGVQRLRRVAGYRRRSAARDAGPGRDVRGHRPPVEPAALDHRAGRRGGRGAPAGTGPVSRTRGQGARCRAGDRRRAQRAGVARQRSRRGHRRGPRPGDGGRSE